MSTLVSITQNLQTSDSFKQSLQYPTNLPSIPHKYLKLCNKFHVTCKAINNGPIFTFPTVQNQLLQCSILTPSKSL